MYRSARILDGYELGYDLAKSAQIQKRLLTGPDNPLYRWTEVREKDFGPR